MFSKIGCDGTSIAELLGGHAGVTDNTVLQYLGIVEQRTNELLQLQAFLQAKVQYILYMYIIHYTCTCYCYMYNIILHVNLFM